ncbi:lipase family protein [Nocardia macrotermitis]|uniref:Putative inactive lipase n=1 Tax=Nocardia macrotermitis TaxID=2585198 RepID=A0A7K0DCP5_9NOCA|nr:lipase family protein [Nocardia macrotermitis]MQY23555.1 putative inactive lipase [Nocardia macrotermitis]
MRSGKRAWVTVLAGTLIVAGGGAVVTPQAWSKPTASSQSPGAVIRAVTSRVNISAPGMPGVVPASSTRMIYASNTTNNAPTSVVGTYLEPTQPWTGPGERPLIAYAGGTQGQSDQCAPSAMLSQVVRFQPPADAIIEYDLAPIYQMLSRGMGVVITDYHDLGTPGIHDFLNRKTQGYAVLDSARAALRLPGSGLNPRSPVLLYGYSQGGMGSAAAAELQPKYAPDLNVRGAYVGAPLVDPEFYIGRNDGRPGVAPAIAWILNGIAADYPDTRPALDAALNNTGKAILHDSIGKCGGGLGDSIVQPQNTSRWTTSGQPITAVIDRTPALKKAFDEQRLGGLGPTVPVRVYTARNDDSMPYPLVRAMAASWCGHGTPVQVQADASVPPMAGIVGTHDLAFFPSAADSQQWMTDRLAGVPAPVNCAALP